MAGILAVVLAVLVGVLVVQRRGDPEPERSGVFVIGDSITVMAGGTKLGPAGWTVDARAGRTTPEGIRVAAANDLSHPSVVVVALGTNDYRDSAAAYGRKVDQMLAAIGQGPDVIWVNVDSHTSVLAPAAQGVNVALDAAAARHRNLRIADWDAYVATQEQLPGLRAGDGIHYGTEGSALRRRWMLALVPS